MAKLTKIVFLVFLLAIIFMPIYSTAQVNYSGKKDRNAEAVDRQEERRIEKNRRANEKHKKSLKRQNARESAQRSREAHRQQHKAQSYSVERDIKSRRVEKEHSKPTPEERLVMKIEKQKAKEDAKKDKLAEKERKKMLKNYHKKVSGAGKDITSRKKVYKRMKKSKRIANKNNKR